MLRWLSDFELRQLCFTSHLGGLAQDQTSHGYRQKLSKIEFDASELLWQTVMNRIVCPCSHLSHFQNRSRWVGNPVNHAQLHQLYRMLSFVAENQEAILKGVNHSLQQMGPRDVSLVFYDVTNSWYETAWDDQQKLVMKIAKKLVMLGEKATERAEEGHH